MRYLKLYEAFESEKISKTIKFLNKTGVKNFKNILFTLCDFYDLPYSKLNDNMFKYLSYNKAIEVNSDNGTKKCKHESEWIKGDFCKNGKIKRTWGKGIRIIECPNCNGTGIEPLKYNLSKIKFWFDIDGNYITSTCVDGSKGRYFELDGKFSENKEDYDVIGFIDNIDEFNKIENGYIYLNEFSGRRNMVSYVYKNINKSYLFQNSLTANLENPLPFKNNISRHCVGMQNVYFREYFRTNNKIGCEVLKPKDGDKVIIKVIDVNDKGVSIGRNSVNSLRQFINKDILKNAHFALILDIDELKEYDYKKRSTTKEDRDSSKKDAYALIDDKTIKNANIERYINKIIDKSIFKVDSDIKNIKRTILRILGGVNIIYFINSNGSSYSLGNVDDVASHLYNLLIGIEENDTNKINSYLSYTNSKIKSSLISTNKYSKIISSKTDEIMNTISSQTNEFENKNALQAHNMVLDLSKVIYDHIKYRELENLEDLEILIQDITYIYSLISGSRISLKVLDNYFNHISGSGWNNSNPYYDINRIDIKKLSDDINSIKNIIKRRLK
jgi:hypothetical protein